MASVGKSNATIGMLLRRPKVSESPLAPTDVGTRVGVDVAITRIRVLLSDGDLYGMNAVPVGWFDTRLRRR